MGRVVVASYASTGSVEDHPTRRYVSFFGTELILFVLAIRQVWKQALLFLNFLKYLTLAASVLGK